MVESKLNIPNWKKTEIEGGGFAVKNEITGNLFRVFRGHAENYSFTSEKGKVLFTDVETEEKAIEKAKKIYARHKSVKREN